MMRARSLVFAILAVLALSACARAPLAVAPDPERETIAARLMQDIAVLASDEFGGRLPGTDGERLTVDYLMARMQQVGLVSGTNDPGSEWRAPVELVNSAPRESRIVFESEAGAITLAPDQGAAFTSASQMLVDADELVFVGGAQEGDVNGAGIAPESLSGQVVVMLGEPGVSPARRARLFAEKPAAIITVVDDAAAMENVRRAYGRERIFLASEEEKRLIVFVSQDAMRAVVGEERWTALLQAADAPGFAPVPMAARVAIDARSRRREFVSSNVIGLLPGRVPQSGAVLLLAHWDHLGECVDAEERVADIICNGAIDNASGIAAMLELSRRLAQDGPHDRDIYVLATSAEESGLLGARAFAEQPPVPLENFVAAFNFDTVAVAPAGSPVGFVGQGRTPLDPVILEVMAQSGRELGDRDFAESFVQRQDGWALLQQGMPAVFLSTAFGSQDVLGPYLAHQYHRPADNIGVIELGGAIDDLLLHHELVGRMASTTYFAPAEPVQNVGGGQ